MQHEFLSRLSTSVQEFIHEIEDQTGIDIQVVPSPELNRGGPTGTGNLEIVINAQSVQLFAPTHGYFPDGAVRHEILHVQRFHIQGVPKLVLAEEAPWDRGFSDALGALDNAIEHVLIVPVELQFHPERREHWESVMQSVCLGMTNVPKEERRLAVCMHWTFLRHVMPNSPQTDFMRSYARHHNLLDAADDFADKFLAAAGSKEEIVQILFLSCPEIPRDRAALEYISSSTGTRQMPIP
ncbi:hypothetical protein [Hylemonella gracilis]|uniref:hypothetical protein n=1 Tax=Hylemonella gracilis TaxID=80880 RepID=UPI00103EE7AE|nr:hypothetical protein [Hylemonella gracilis]